MTLMTTQSSQFSTYLRVIRIIAAIDSTIMQESQNGKASGWSDGIVTFSPRPDITDTATRVRNANTGLIKTVIKAMATTQATNQAMAFGKGSQRICSSASC